MLGVFNREGPHEVVEMNVELMSMELKDKSHVNINMFVLVRVISFELCFFWGCSCDYRRWRTCISVIVWISVELGSIWVYIFVCVICKDMYVYTHLHCPNSWLLILSDSSISVLKAASKNVTSTQWYPTRPKWCIGRCFRGFKYPFHSYLLGSVTKSR